LLLLLLLLPAALVVGAGPPHRYDSLMYREITLLKPSKARMGAVM
jgi:hypothetical protein